MERPPARVRERQAVARPRGVALACVTVALLSTGCTAVQPLATAQRPVSASAPVRVVLPRAQRAAVERATSSLIVRSDLGGRWRRVLRGKGVLRAVRSPGRLGCAFAPAGAIDPGGLAAAVEGPVFRRAGSKRTVTTAALAFMNEASARAAVAAFRGESWRGCWTDVKTVRARASTASGSGTWRSEPLIDSAPGDTISQGVVRLLREPVGDADASEATQQDEQFSLFRIGEVLLIVAAESTTRSTDAPGLANVSGDEIFEATLAALTRLTALPERMPGADRAREPAPTEDLRS